MESGFKYRDVISITDFNRKDLELLFDRANTLEQYSKSRLRLLENKVMALAFFEPSTRTRMSFETAMKRLGGSTIGFTSEEAISIAKGETLGDTIRMLDAYSDIIVIRHRLEGAAKYAAEVASVPVINGGDGKQHHPTQAMIDLYTIWRIKGGIDGLTYGVLGDLKYARTSASFTLALGLFRPKKIYLISHPLLKMRENVKRYLRSRGIEFEEVERADDVIEELDVLYVTRIQKERFPDPSEYEKVKGTYIVNMRLISKAKSDMIILHPLPRTEEIDRKIDTTPHAAYFKQARWGVPIRMALLTLIFDVEV
ncbi:MAG: aspartate carbamoyltransferase [Thermoprotei archaeon]|nr:MAG: aspartate carbamoyltransferase [Thermoprotei archaeon]